MRLFPIARPKARAMCHMSGAFFDCAAVALPPIGAQTIGPALLPASSLCARMMFS